MAKLTTFLIVLFTTNLSLEDKFLPHLCCYKKRSVIQGKISLEEKEVMKVYVFFLLWGTVFWHLSMSGTYLVYRASTFTISQDTEISAPNIGLLLISFMR